MFDTNRDELEASARQKAQSAKEDAREKLGSRAVDATEQAFPEETQRRRRSSMAKAFGAGIAVGVTVLSVLRRRR